MIIYVVTLFGCNSGYNDMYPPSTKVFTHRDEAYEYYHKLVDPLIDESGDLPVDHYQSKKEDCVIQHGGDDGAKRPVGVKISEEILS